MNNALRVALPNGSLWERLRMHLLVAGFTLKEPDRTGKCGQADGIEFYQLDRRMVPAFVTSGAFHAGITGHDLWLNNGRDNLRSVEKFSFSRTSDQPSRWVLATKVDMDMAGKHIRIACELPGLADLLLPSCSLPCTYSVLRIDGSEEQCVKHGIADAVLVVTETGNSISANGLKIVDGCESLLVSMPELRACTNLTDVQEDTLLGLSLALKAVVGAQEFVMVAFDIPSHVDLITLGLLASVAPTISALTDSSWHAASICIPRSAFGSTVCILKKAGAKGIVMQDLHAHLS